MAEDGGQSGTGAPGGRGDPWQPPEGGGPGGHGYGYGYGDGYPGGPAWGGPPLPNGQSVAAMVLGIVSLVLVATCYGSVLAVITSPVALGLGLAARQRAERGELGGRDQATAGFVMGIIGLALSTLVTVLIVFVMVASTGDGAAGTQIPSPVQSKTTESLV